MPPCDPPLLSHPLPPCCALCRPQASVPVPRPRVRCLQPRHALRLPAGPAPAARPARGAAAGEQHRVWVEAQGAPSSIAPPAAAVPVCCCKHTSGPQTHPQVHSRIVESLLQLVEAERSGEAVNRYLLKRQVAPVTPLLPPLALLLLGSRDVATASGGHCLTHPRTRHHHLLLAGQSTCCPTCACMRTACRCGRVYHELQRSCNAALRAWDAWGL